MSGSPNLRYLLVTHIPFARGVGGRVTLDGLWARDLEGLVAATGPIRVAAPELETATGLRTWGPSAVTLGEESGLTFVGFPAFSSSRDILGRMRMRAVLRRQVAWADLVHTSNGFPPYVGTSFAHDRAVRLGKKTLFVIAEDFRDMLEWEWVRTAEGSLSRWRRSRRIGALDRRARKSAATASLTFLHTPAAVLRYRDAVRNGVSIRQPGHEVEDIIGEDRMRAKCAEIEAGVPLRIVAACRHRAMKGLEFLVGAAALLAGGGIRVEAVLYGEGEDTERLRRLALRSGVADRVSFPGPLPPGEAVYRAVAEGHLFAMPHRTTDFGRAFFDAMAGAAPVVAFRTPASVDTVRDGVDGLLSPLDDVEGLAAAVRRFHEDRPFLVRAARAARERARVNTRSAWFGWRAAWTRALFSDGTP